MPLPIWYLEFEKDHGREPRPEELTNSQKRSLLLCCLKNRNNDLQEESIHEMEKLLKYIQENPIYWHEIRRVLEREDRRMNEAIADLDEFSLLLKSSIPEGFSRFFMRKMMEVGPDELLEKLKDALSSARRPIKERGHWDRIVREVIGLDADLDHLAKIFE